MPSKVPNKTSPKGHLLMLSVMVLIFLTNREISKAKISSANNLILSVCICTERSLSVVYKTIKIFVGPSKFPKYFRIFKTLSIRRYFGDNYRAKL